MADLDERDEAVKRDAVLHALGAVTVGWMLELGAGNGSNRRKLANRALRVDATEATCEGTRLVARAVARRRGARAMRLVVPATLPQPTYDAIVVAELLDQLNPRAMKTLARQIASHLRPSGVLVLAHHRITFYDVVQQADGIHHGLSSQRGRADNAAPYGARRGCLGKRGRWRSDRNAAGQRFATIERHPVRKRRRPFRIDGAVVRLVMT